MATRHVLVVLTGGGFSFEGRQLLAGLGSDVSVHYLMTPSAGTPGQDGLPPGPAHLVPKFASKTKTFFGRSVYAFARSFTIALRVMRAQRIDALIGVGSSHSVPAMLAARAARVPTIYLESITRVDRLSSTGRIVYRGRLADLFIVQWPALAASYPAARLGTVL